MLNRSVKPAPNGIIKFKTPIIEKIISDNSCNIYFNKKETLPIVQLNIYIPSGSIYNPTGKEGVSYLTSMLLDEGAGNLSGFDISDKLELMGSILNINSNKEFTSISLLCMKEKLEESLDILSKIILQPNLSNDDFNRQKLKLITKNIQLEDDPSFVASTLFNKTIFQRTSYQFPSSGTNSSLDNISNLDVKDFFNNNFIPNGSFIIVVGNLEKSECQTIINNYLSNWKSVERMTPIFPKIESNKKIVFSSKTDAVQSELRIGHFSKGRNTEDFYARTILNSILGGQFSSRINLNLREAKGYTYGAHSNYNYNALGSTFLVSTSVKTENTGDAIKEILYELNEIKKDIKQSEIDFAKSYLIRRFPSMFETYSQIASNISLIPLFDLPENYFETYVDELDKVTIEDVLKAANDNIDFNKLLITVVGDENSVKDQLKQFDEFELENL
ncbi:MAG: insulinase family protein [Ignavibacteriae bacterium]|nr:insulinase family protein [Ignavibacteriota bacterium]